MSSLPNSTPTHGFVQIIDPRGVHATSLGLRLPFCFGKTQSCTRHLVITRATWPLAARYGVYPDRKRLLQHGGEKGVVTVIQVKSTKECQSIQCRYNAVMQRGPVHAGVAASRLVLSNAGSMQRVCRDVTVYPAIRTHNRKTAHLVSRLFNAERTHTYISSKHQTSWPQATGCPAPGSSTS
jgi:hypothetical protein